MAVQKLFSDVLGDGARNNKFDLLFQFAAPSQSEQSKNIPMLVKATEFPAKGHQVINFKYKGRDVPIRGQVVYKHQWNCTFYLSEDHSLKKAFENWIEALDEVVHYANALDNGVNSVIEDFAKSSGLYTTDVILYQVNFSETARSSKYILHDVFPVEVAPIDLSYEGGGEISTFQVTFSYSYFSEESAVYSAGKTFSDASQKFVASPFTTTNSGSSSYFDPLPKSGSISSSNRLYQAFQGTSGGTGSNTTSSFPTSSNTGAIYDIMNNIRDAYTSSKAYFVEKTSSVNSSLINNEIVKKGILPVKEGLAQLNYASATAKAINDDFTKSIQLIQGQTLTEFQTLISPLNEIAGTLNGIKDTVKSYANTVNMLKSTAKSTINGIKSSIKSTVSSLKN